MRRPVSFQGPYFHFSKTLATELRLATQRLLSNEGIRPDGPGVDLIVDQVRKLEHIDISHGHFLVKRFTATSINQGYFPIVWEFGFLEFLLDLLFRSTVKNRCFHGLACNLSSPTQMRL